MKLMDKIYNYIYIPKNIKIIVWKNEKIKLNKIFLLSENKKFCIITYKQIQIDKWSNCLIIKKNTTNRSLLKIDNFIYNFLKSWNFYFYCKIKFKGKGFRIKFFKKIKLIKFFFGRSHKTFVILKNIKKKKINKYKFIVYGLIDIKIKNISKKITNIKKINFYTLRGLRLSRQIILKRKGKKGTYI